MIRRVLGAVCALTLLASGPVPSVAQDTGGGSGVATSPCGFAPAPAQGAGYCTKTFATDLTFKAGAGGIDTGLTYATGFQWYLFNCVGTTPTAANVAVNSDGSVSVGQGGNTFNANLSSAGCIAGAPKYIGTAFGGGAYFEATLLFTSSSQTITTGFPAWWTLPLEHMTNPATDSWSGQVANYVAYYEGDIMENFLGNFSLTTSQYNVTNIHWSGVFNSTCPPTYCSYTEAVTKTLANAGQFGNYHRYGLLWIPATASVRGSLSYYFDGQLIATRFYSQWVAASDAPPPSASAPFTFGVVDGQHLVLLLGSQNAVPLQVANVDVWQASSASNLHN